MEYFPIIKFVFIYFLQFTTATFIQSGTGQDTPTTPDPDQARICGIDYDELAATDDLKRTCRAYRAQVVRDQRQREAIAMEDALRVDSGDFQLLKKMLFNFMKQQFSFP